MRFLFDAYVLDGGQRELRHGVEAVALEPLVFDLLAYLLTNRNRVVSKDEVLASVWSGRNVSDSALASRIAAARRAIGDTGEAQKLIRTIARKGFRFVGEVHVQENAATIQAKPSAARLADSPQSDMAAALALPDKPSIAVLSFVNLSNDSAQEYFSDGMADDIITELSQDRSLFVIARNSSFSYKGRAVDVKQIAQEMGVRYVLEGSVRRAGGQIRVNAQLIDAVTGNHIWAKRYDRPVEAIFTMQDEITAAVVHAILPAVANAERQRVMRKTPDSLSAWEAWQRALWHWSRGDLLNSRDFLQRAVTLDRHFAPPRAMLAWLYLSEATLGVGPPLRDMVALAHAEVQTAIELDPDSAIAHAMLAWVLTHQGDRGPALEEAETAIILNVNDPQGYASKGHVLISLGRPAEAREPLATALRLDPRGPIAAVVLHLLTVGSYFEREYATAEAVARRVIRAWPEFPRPYLWLAATLGQLGRRNEARAALDAVVAASPNYLKHHTSQRLPYFQPEDHEHLLDGLRKAGWQGRGIESHAAHAGHTA